MTDTALAGASADTAAPKRPARPSRPAAKPHGQWKVDGKTPLNANETWKQEDDGLNVRERIETIYSKEGFDAIPGQDLHGRFRWWGLYTQRKPGIDGGKTATLEPHELEDKYFMLRVRIDGGALTTEQLRVIGQISVDFARDSADLTDRQNIQLHWIRVEDIPEIWTRLEGVGLSTTEACGDVPRVILGSPVAGIAKDEIIDPTPLIAELGERFIGNPLLSNLPRKYKTAITGHPSQDVVHEINDFALVGVKHPELGIGYDLWAGGALSTNPMLGKRLGAFVRPEEAAEVWLGVTSIFRDYGYRRMRTKARLKFLMADWGPEKFRQILEDEYLGYKLADGPAAPKPTTPGDHVGVHEQKDGKFFIGATPLAGRLSGAGLVKLADTLEARGSYRLRTTPHQKLVVLDVRKGPGRAPGGRAGRPGPVRPPLRVPPRHHRLHRHRILQTGHRGDQAHGRHGGCRAGTPPRGPRGLRPAAAGTVAAHQRLPQLLRPHPDRGHRPQGHDAANARRRPLPGFPGPPGRRAGFQRP
jgi:sulfite reductase (ferredoxin)